MSTEVNHPKHYNQGKIEVIEFIEDQNLNSDFHLANALKYICRAGKKDITTFTTDLEKAVWYLQRRIELTKPVTLRRRPNDMNTKDRECFLYQGNVLDPKAVRVRGHFKGEQHGEDDL